MRFAEFSFEKYTTIDSENFVNLVNRKQKLHLSEVYFLNCCTKMWIKLSVWVLLRGGESKVRRRVLN